MVLDPSAALSIWYAAARRGEISPDDLVALVQGEAPNTVVSDGTTAVPLADSIVSWLAQDTVATLALPVPGDLVGLAGPAAFNAAALAAEEAVVLPGVGFGLVPAIDARTLVWHSHPAAAPPYTDVREADRRLRSVLLATTERLVELDVAKWQPEIPDLLANHRHRPAVLVPRHWDPRRAEALDRALLCRDITRLALADDGGAVSAWEMQQRREALRDLDSTARTVLVACCSDSLGAP